jgi:thymidine kinase
MRSPVVYCGPMWGGKTEALIARLTRARLQNIATLAFQPVQNTRYSADSIVAHSGARFPALAVASGDEVLRAIQRERPSVVGIDEFFMIEGALPAVRQLVRAGLQVAVATLDLDSEGRVWESVGQLLAIAQEVVKCPAVCAQCKRDAFFTFRKATAPEDRVLVGTSDFYEPRCQGCFEAGQKAKQEQGGAGSLFGSESSA